MQSPRPWQDWELVVLRLMRQLPRDNPARRAAEDFIFNHGSGPEMAFRGPDDHRSRLPAHICGRCGRTMMHCRLKGYRCTSCD